MEHCNTKKQDQIIDPAFKARDYNQLYVGKHFEEEYQFGLLLKIQSKIFKFVCINGSFNLGSRKMFIRHVTGIIEMDDRVA